MHCRSYVHTEATRKVPQTRKHSKPLNSCVKPILFSRFGLRVQGLGSSTTTTTTTTTILLLVLVLTITIIILIIMPIILF